MDQDTKKIILDSLPVIWNIDGAFANLLSEAGPLQSNRVSVEATRIINAEIDRLWAEVADSDPLTFCRVNKKGVQGRILNRTLILNAEPYPSSWE